MSRRKRRRNLFVCKNKNKNNFEVSFHRKVLPKCFKQMLYKVIFGSSTFTKTIVKQYDWNKQTHSTFFFFFFDRNTFNIQIANS